MTRGDTTRFGTRFFAALAVAFGLFSSTVLAAKPPAPPPPTGTIYYRSGDVYYGIRADGTGLTQNLLPNWTSLNPYFSAAAAMNPSNLPVGSDSTRDRWWLTTLDTGGQDDLFAVRPNGSGGLEVKQLTDLFGVVQISAWSGWSNDSNEESTSFAAALAVDSDGVACTIRLPLRASDISDPDFVPAGPDTMTPAELDSLFYPDMAGLFSLTNNPQGILSPDGLDYVLSDPATTSNSTTPQRLIIADALSDYPANSFVLWDGNTGGPRQPTYAEWSPNGQKVAFIGVTNNGTGDLWIQSTSGGAPSKLLSVSSKGLSTFTYTNPVWSPDSNYVAVFKQEIRSGQIVARWLVRVATSNGSSVELTPVPHVPFTFSSPLRWTRNN